MTNKDRIVLVAGATGRQGGGVVRHMLPKGWSLRALTRNPKSYAAQQLAQQGLELVQGGMDDPASLERAARGVYGIFSVQDFWTVSARREVQQCKNLADAAKRAGVEHLVYNSAGGAERNTGITHWETKGAVEKYIRSLKLPTTIFRPAAFMEVYHITEVESGLLKGNQARVTSTVADITSKEPRTFSGFAREFAAYFRGEQSASAMTAPLPSSR